MFYIACWDANRPILSALSGKKVTKDTGNYIIILPDFLSCLLLPWLLIKLFLYTLTGALPSGRLAGKAFTPGLTPEPHASKNILDNIRDVAKLKAENMNNNIAFNVKVVPGAQESHQKVVDNIYSYVKTYSDLGGMQMQLNVVSSKTLRDAMEHPENYQNLLVRISGYNAYFVTLNREMQIELIERAEFGI